MRPGFCHVDNRSQPGHVEEERGYLPPSAVEYWHLRVEYALPEEASFRTT